MNIVRYIIALGVVGLWNPGQTAQRSELKSVPEQPQALIRALYTQVVARHPTGIPEGADMTIFAPYLSTALRHRIEQTKACYEDFIRRYPDPDVKPPFGWLESGLFSGSDERTSPHDFEIERTLPEKNGSVRVFVRLTYQVPSGRLLVWRVAVDLVREDGRLAVDDVLYLKDEYRDVETKLSEALSEGCDGARWIGVGKPRKLKPQQEP